MPEAGHQRRRTESHGRRASSTARAHPPRSRQRPPAVRDVNRHRSGLRSSAPSGTTIAWDDVRASRIVAGEPGSAPALPTEAAVSVQSATDARLRPHGAHQTALVVETRIYPHSHGRRTHDRPRSARFRRPASFAGDDARLPRRSPATQQRPVVSGRPADRRRDRRHHAPHRARTDTGGAYAR
jgi:hypothetical protein